MAGTSESGSSGQEHARERERVHSCEFFYLQSSGKQDRQDLTSAAAAGGVRLTHQIAFLGIQRARYSNRQSRCTRQQPSNSFTILPGELLLGMSTLDAPSPAKIGPLGRWSVSVSRRSSMKAGLAYAQISPCLRRERRRISPVALSLPESRCEGGSIASVVRRQLLRVLLPFRTRILPPSGIYAFAPQSTFSLLRCCDAPPWC